MASSTRTRSRDGSDREQRLLSVGQLLAGLKGLLDHHVGRVLVVGEISNLHRARSGHSYFTMKDDDGQIRAALFRGNATRLRFELEEGLEVVADAEVSIYAARGDLQLIVRELTPRGVGALQLAFEQLRRRLEAAGLFAEERKRAVPAFPRRLGVVTSPTSAAVRDVLKVAARRSPSTPILISPTLVQGDEAPAQIVAALERLARVPGIDTILLVRGGGSLEDLWAFNTEPVAHAIAASPIPIVCGVGHETDLTIADLVADLRAPTPSAAAMQALPDSEAIATLVERDQQRLLRAIRRLLETAQQRVDRLEAVLHARSPGARLALARSRALRARDAAESAVRRLVAGRRRRLGEAAARVDALSPLAVLGRGYALVRRTVDARIVRGPDDVSVDDELELTLSAGTIEARVTTLGRSPEKP
jgi:exodeoxyribonuclease VII large subunit